VAGRGGGGGWRRVAEELRRKIAYAIWAVASWVYPYVSFDHDSETERAWEISGTIWATEEVAKEVFDRVSDATCGVEHHALDPCPAPQGVFGMHPADAPPEHQGVVG